jgi:hypothetical protein
MNEESGPFEGKPQIEDLWFGVVVKVYIELFRAMPLCSLMGAN